MTNKIKTFKRMSEAAENHIRLEKQLDKMTPKIKRVAIFISPDELDLLDKVDSIAKENCMSRSIFTKMSWIVYMKFLKRRVY